MGNCCSNEDGGGGSAHIQGIANKPIAMDESLRDFSIAINYGPLRRDEDSIPNTVTFGPPVILHEGEDILASQSMLRNASQIQYTLQQSQIRETFERSFRAEIDSPDRTNRVRQVQEQEEGGGGGHYMTEPLASQQRSQQAMELNKNMRTPSPTNSVFNPGSTLANYELPFFHTAAAAAQSKLNTSTANLASSQYIVTNLVRSQQQQQLSRAEPVSANYYLNFK